MSAAEDSADLSGSSRPLDESMEEMEKGEEDYEKVMSSSLLDTSMDDLEACQESTSLLDTSMCNKEKLEEGHLDAPVPRNHSETYNSSSQLNTSMDDQENLKEKCEKLKELISEAETRKSEMFIEKLDADEKRKEAEVRVRKLAEQEEELNSQMDEEQKLYQRECNELNRENIKMNEEMQALHSQIDKAMEELRTLAEVSQIKRKVPRVNINFKAEKAITNPSADDMDLDTHCKNFVEITNPLVLQRGQALLTFEEDKVAENVVKRRNHKLDFNGVSADVKAYNVQLNKTVKFEVDTTISNKKMKIQDLPSYLPSELIKDKLELTFYKPSIGGGEIESVEYDKERNEAIITFLNYGVVQRILRQSKYEINFGDCGCEVTVKSIIDVQLSKLQMISPTVPRTVLLSEIKNIRESEDDIQDAIELYFQRPSNGGGEVEAILYTKDREKVPVFEFDSDEFE